MSGDELLGSGSSSAGLPSLTEEGLPAVAELLEERGRLALCLDFDGTLAPIVEEPDAAAIPADTRRLLESLAERPAVEIAIVSGRALTDVRERVGVEGIDYAGNHGLEIDRGGDVWIHPAVERHRSALRRTCCRLESRLACVVGCRIEDKHATATVHYRQAGPAASRTVRSAVDGVVSQEDGLRTTAGDQIVEIRPDVEWDKGEAVRKLTEDQAGAATAYVGDDRTDVDAFRVLAEEEGSVRVAVGEALPFANYRVGGPEEVRAFLEWLDETVRDPAPE